MFHLAAAALSLAEHVALGPPERPRRQGDGHTIAPGSAGAGGLRGEDADTTSRAPDTRAGRVRP